MATIAEQMRTLGTKFDQATSKSDLKSPKGIIKLL